MSGQQGKLDDAVSDSLRRLRVLYLQSVPADKIPFSALIPAAVNGDFQEALYNTVLSEDATAPYPPAARYTRRFLRLLIDTSQKRLGEDEELNGDILTLYLDTLSESDPSTNFADITKPAYITYILPPSCCLPFEESKIVISERKQLLSADGHTGSRTWEAALALGEYFLSNATSLDKPLWGTRVLELGAGTAFTSILLSKIRAEYVLATDGDERVCEAIQTNINLNIPKEFRDKSIAVSQLLWGTTQADSHIYFDPWDLIVGGDITYDTSDLSDLIYTLNRLLQKNKERSPAAIISATMRNEDTIREFERQLAGTSLTFTSQEVGADGRQLWYYGSDFPIRIYTIRTI
ncbi:Protein-lysine N-methyltransferase EFM3 [Drechslerella dactyloides]|uniref:Protein-lysine N-methyltransferase EFM3 n=1 Tax=Drechslerella dactyloides TaxID=74499 RepID=A0AAD6J6Q1_DREDA|nr:Protein-lysine N-methyltransferase EFM3 [Drechslerella dactyloides]